MSNSPRNIDIDLDRHPFPVPQCILESVWNDKPWVEITVPDPPMKEQNAALTVEGKYRF